MKTPDVHLLTEGVLKGDRSALARAITLVESLRSDHQEMAAELIENCLPHSGNSMRIGITGVPGVGKSSFIEQLGLLWCNEESSKLAVLAIDPSSHISHGSIMGDKTRMNELSRHPSAFIRPTAAGNSLGGVARNTRESILLCEAAGFDKIIVETVGVGQSEHAVHSMTDLFLLLMLPGAGDELQGIKRGIMEMADMIVVNKADGEMKNKAKEAIQDLKIALHMLPPHPSEWITQVYLSSSLMAEGFGDIRKGIQQFEEHQKLKGQFKKRRATQNLFWMQEHLRYLLQNGFNQYKNVKQFKNELEKSVSESKMNPFNAAKELYQTYLNSIKHD